MENQGRRERVMDYKSVIEEQIREMQKVQDETAKVDHIVVKATEMRKNAETIAELIKTIKLYNM
jgi:hypothetical protein